MTKSRVLHGNWRALAKKSCEERSCCTPAGRWILVCSIPCGSLGLPSAPCIRCNRSAVLPCPRSKAEFLPWKVTCLRFAWPARLRDRLADRSEEHTSELQSQSKLVCSLLL